MATTTTETLPKEPSTEDIPGITRPMTYEEYLASPEEMARYDIIDGWKIYRRYGAEQLPNPTRDHQRLQGNLYISFRAFGKTSRMAEAILPPCDVLIRSKPTRTRQPDILLISNERLAQNPPSSDPAPLSPAPELVVEILSPSDTRRVQQEKIADYCAVGVRECWLVNRSAETVEALRLSPEGAETVAVYEIGQTAASAYFVGLTVPVEFLFTG